MISKMPLSKAQLARELGVSRTYITLLTNGKRKPNKEMVDRLAKLKLIPGTGVNSRTFEHLTFNQDVTGFRVLYGLLLHSSIAYCTPSPHDKNTTTPAMKLPARARLARLVFLLSLSS